MKESVVPSAATNRRGWKILFFSLLTLAGTMVIQVVGFLVAMLLHLPEEGLLSTTVYQVVAAGGAVLGMVILGGASWLALSRSDIMDALRTTRAIIIADALLLLVMSLAFVSGGVAIAPNWLPNLGITALMCLGIGIFEELLYRGIILNGILAVAGKSHRGTMCAVVITSLLFGLGHVDMSCDFSDPFLAAQAVLKIIQTGLFSVVLCSIVLRTKRLGGASIVHALSNFLIMVPSLVLAGEQLSTEYVNAGSDGIATIVVYLATIALYLPIAIIAIRRMRKERIASRGAFMERDSHKDMELTQCTCA